MEGPIIFLCQECPKSVIARQYLTLNELLEHHYIAHERELPKEVKSNVGTIGYPNSSSWVDVLGKSHKQTD